MDTSHRLWTAEASQAGEIGAITVIHFSTVSLIHSNTAGDQPVCRKHPEAYAQDARPSTPGAGVIEARSRAGPGVLCSGRPACRLPSLPSGQQPSAHTRRLSDEVSDNRHGQRRTSADPHGRSAAGHRRCGAGSERLYLGSGRRGHLHTRAMGRPGLGLLDSSGGRARRLTSQAPPAVPARMPVIWPEPGSRSGRGVPGVQSRNDQLTQLALVIGTRT